MSYPNLLTPEEKLASAKNDLGIRDVVVLCGSMRFAEEMAEALKLRLDDQHRQKIRLADRAIVVGDYIGESTRAEIAYARELGKPVRFTHPAVDPAA
ncbi:hypothetical protein [Streptomyces sp. NPDC059786]|uniref:hypothetical protein n=1 Tax=Streptomyces sp. NPDC059786 TaxID=3346946 RepID=UPI0036513B20